MKYDDKGDENDYIMILKRVMTHHHENVLSAKHSGLVTEKKRLELEIDESRLPEMNKHKVAAQTEKVPLLTFSPLIWTGIPYMGRI